MVGVVSAIVFGTILGAVVATGVTRYALKNAGQKGKTAKMQKKAVKGKLRGKRLDRALIKNYKRQITAIKWGQMPLMEKVNSFSYKVNNDTDFAPLWEQSNYLGKSNKILRKLSICKSRIKIAELKNKKVGKWQKKRDKIINSYGIGPMKEMGWMESLPNAGGGKFVNQIKGYGAFDAGAYDCGIDNEIRYQLASSSDDTKGYDASDLFQKALGEFRKRSESGCDFSRFGVNYPVASGLIADRFVVGDYNSDAKSSKMFQTSKSIILANACAKLLDNPEVKKVQIIDESKSSKERVKCLNKNAFADYVGSYLSSKSGKIACAALKKIDVDQADKINEVLTDFVKKYKTKTATK